MWESCLVVPFVFLAADSCVSVTNRILNPCFLEETLWCCCLLLLTKDNWIIFMNEDIIYNYLTLVFLSSHRRGSVEAMWHPGPLPGRHQPLGHGHRGVPDAETKPVPQRRLRLCQEEEVQHFPKLQLHGPAPGLWEDAGAEQSLWQPAAHQRGAALLHHADQSQRLPAGHAGVDMRIGGTGALFSRFLSRLWGFLSPWDA